MDLEKAKEMIESNEGFVIKINNKTLENSLKLLTLQKDSCRNLFTSYINSTTESANNFNLEKFLEKYFSYELKFQDIILSILHQNIGKELTDEILYCEKHRRVNLINDFKDIIIN